MNVFRYFAVCSLLLSLIGCTSVVNATHDEPIQDDRGTRTLGRKIDDSLIETKASVNISKAHPELESASHIIVASYNGIVLLAGQTPRQELKRLAEQAVASIQGVRGVRNELQITNPSSALARSTDAWLTTRIKSVMLTDNSISSARIRVITENGIVYLMGLVTRPEADRATNAAQGVSGVQRIVRVFEYID
ncbi:osmotically-inducible protein OsmY [Azomonas agilis]|uniref:Osmotically-inducible protein OsmY n=1 Tax=Azomonas agilis TaxID=116849 RepID=A0A562J318_9GAMM|nr:BON domain-containing protein [Azomonas agilis]TWH77537.1 osmotically-inducible protein OsmY [Azomonas agilis]